MRARVAQEDRMKQGKGRKVGKRAATTATTDDDEKERERRGGGQRGRSGFLRESNGR